MAILTISPSSADLDWNSLPVQTAYLPLVQGSVEFLAGPRGVASEPIFTTGEDVSLALEEQPREQALPVVTPEGTAGEARVESSGESIRAVYRGAEAPGFYQFYLGDDEIPVPVNTTREESDIRLLSPEALDSMAGVLPVQVVRWDRSALEEEGLEGTIDPAPWLFGLLLVFLLVEGLVASGVRRPVGAAA